MLNEDMTEIIGYIFGYVNLQNYYCELSQVYINNSYRGHRLCSPLVETYIEMITGLYPTKEFILFNVGGTKACVCYTNAFKNKGFLIKKQINCLNEDEAENYMEFYTV